MCAEQRQRIQIGPAPPRSEVQAAPPGAMRGRGGEGEGAEYFARLHSASLLQDAAHRLVGRDQTVGMLHRDHPAPGDHPAEPHGAGLDRTHCCALGRDRDVDPAMAGPVRVCGRLEW